MRQKNKSKNPNVEEKKNKRTMLSSNSALFGSKKLKFIKDQEACWLLSSLGIRTAFSKIPLVSRLLFSVYWQITTKCKMNEIVNKFLLAVKCKMNEIVNKFLLAGDKFMHEMHLRQPAFMYCDCGPFTKSKERTQKFKETGDSQYISQNELDTTCFQHDMANGEFKDLPSTAASDKVLRDKEFNIAKNPKNDVYQKGLASMVYKFLIRDLLVLILLLRAHVRMVKDLHCAN